MIEATPQHLRAPERPYPEPAISVSGLRKSYGPREVVHGIDLDVRPGEIFAFLGPNGAGKTTTVEILEGFRERSGGKVSVLGYEAAMEAAGAEPLLLAGGFEHEAGDAAAARLLEEGLPDAVLAVNDEVAIGLVTGLRSRGIDVLGRVSVAGIDDTRPARLVDLTSVSLPLHEMGTRAARVVVNGGGDDVVLAHRLVPRTTTAPRRP